MMIVPVVFFIFSQSKIVETFSTSGSEIGGLYEIIYTHISFIYIAIKLFNYKI